MKCFIWIFLLPLKYGVFGADEMKAVTEGDHLTLQTGFSEIQVDDRIVWLYGSEVIARIEKANGILNTYDVADGRFSGKLELDKQTGSLIIKDIRIKNAGDYQLVNKGVKAGKFMVTVYARLPTPAIVFSDCPQTPAGSSKICAVQCSVQTVEEVTLSWYKGNNLVSSKVSDTCSSTSLRLEVDYDDKNIYSCTVNNPIRNQTTHLDISGLCHKCAAVPVPDTGLSPGAVALIVIVLLLLAAAVAAVMYYYLCPRITNLPSQTWSVPHGDYVTLNPETEIQTGDEIQWLFGYKDALIAEIKGEKREMKTYDGPGEIFMYRLKLETTGSLSIEFIRTKHSGLYTLKIRRGRKTLYKRFNVSVEERMRRLVKEGDPVFLNPDKEKEKGDEIQWLFGDEEQQTVLGEIKNTKVTEYADERFRDRLKLNETGKLTITNLTTEHTGRYTLKITRGREKIYNKFYISVGEWKITETEGKPVTLKPAYDVNKDDLIRWLFGDEEQQTLIAEIKGETGEILTYADVADGIFRDRLELDKTIGSLIINNTRTAHSGVYKLLIFSRSEVTEQIFIVTVKYKVEEKVLKGEDSVTLKPDTVIQRDDQVLWMFGYQDKLIAQIRGGTVETYDDVNKRFRDRLKLDKTGSLTVKEIEAEHMGLYKLQIISNSRGTLYKRFKVLIPLSYVAVTAGESVHLHTDLTEIQRDDEIEWMFGDKNSLIAEIKRGTVETHDVPDEIFRDRLKLNEKTGDLIIKNSRAEHTGRYKLKIRSSKGNTNRIYSVIIRYAAVTKEVRTESLMKEKSDSRGNRVNESATVVMEKDPLLDGDYVNVENEEGMSSL